MLKNITNRGVELFKKRIDPFTDLSVNQADDSVKGMQSFQKSYQSINFFSKNMKRIKSSNFGSTVSSINFKKTVNGSRGGKCSALKPKLSKGRRGQVLSSCKQDFDHLETDLDAEEGEDNLGLGLKNHQASKFASTGINFKNLRASVGLKNSPKTGEKIVKNTHKWNQGTTKETKKPVKTHKRLFSDHFLADFDFCEEDAESKGFMGRKMRKMNRSQINPRGISSVIHQHLPVQRVPSTKEIKLKDSLCCEVNESRKWRSFAACEQDLKRDTSINASRHNNNQKFEKTKKKKRLTFGQKLNKENPLKQSLGDIHKPGKRIHASTEGYLGKEEGRYHSVALLKNISGANSIRKRLLGYERKSSSVGRYKFKKRAATRSFFG